MCRPVPNVKVHLLSEHFEPFIGYLHLSTDSSAPFARAPAEEEGGRRGVGWLAGWLAGSLGWQGGGKWVGEAVEISM